MSYNVQGLQLVTIASLAPDPPFGIIGDQRADRKVGVTFVSPGFAAFQQPGVLVQRKNSDGTWATLRGQ
jgi:hypothetical protein